MDFFLKRKRKKENDYGGNVKKKKKKKKKSKKDGMLSEKRIAKMVKTLRSIVGEEISDCELRSALFRANYELDIAVAIYFETMQTKKRKEKRNKNVVSKTKQRDTGEGLCKFCKSPADHAYVPCGHLCVCSACLESESNSTASYSSCPVCLNDSKAIRIYTA